LREFATQTEAKRFFVERILEQASRDSIFLSGTEQYMLSWSESDPDFKVDVGRASTFEQETTDAKFESKIAQLIKHAYEREASMKARYRAARAKLAEGDHYLLIMIDRALGLRVRMWWPF
jgi:hypothetical protein